MQIHVNEQYSENAWNCPVRSANNWSDLSCDMIVYLLRFTEIIQYMSSFFKSNTHIHIWMHASFLNIYIYNTYIYIYTCKYLSIYSYIYHFYIIPFVYLWDYLMRRVRASGVRPLAVGSIPGPLRATPVQVTLSSLLYLINNYQSSLIITINYQ